MKILVATNETQGQRKNDFDFVPDGEPVMFGIECSSPKGRRIDGPCGCRRSLSGVFDLRGTTTMAVVERDDMSGADLRTFAVEYLKRMGFLTDCARSVSSSQVIEEYLLGFSYIRQFCEPLMPGTVVERRGEVLQVRQAVPFYADSSLT